MSPSAYFMASLRMKGILKENANIKAVNFLNEKFQGSELIERVIAVMLSSVFFFERSVNKKSLPFPGKKGQGGVVYTSIEQTGSVCPSLSRGLRVFSEPLETFVHFLSKRFRQVLFKLTVKSKEHVN